MNSFIVPIDFSETSHHAARFAAHLTSQVQRAHIVLYHVFDPIEAGSDGTPLESDDEDRKKIMEVALQSVVNELSGITNAKISCVAEPNSDFVDSLESYVHRNSIDMIVMGITGASRVEQIFMGSNTLKVVNRRIAPLIIIPPDAQFHSAKNIMLITDFKDIDKTMPIAPIKQVLNLFKANLHVVNVDSEHYVELTDEYKKERAKLDEMIKEYNPEYYFIRMFDFVDAINQFVKDRNIDIILTVPKEHSVFSYVFKTTHTSKLAYHSHVPIIAIHS
ncbi:MAG TPA: universal stress protein [Puia sp.]|nr:universal stress protein [Puia sp.]